MTALEKLKKDHPEWDEYAIRDHIQFDCPSFYGYIGDPKCATMWSVELGCKKCWNREIPEEKEKEPVTNDVKELTELSIAGNLNDLDDGLDITLYNYDNNGEEVDSVYISLDPDKVDMLYKQLGRYAKSNQIVGECKESLDYEAEYEKQKSEIAYLKKCISGAEEMLKGHQETIDNQRHTIDKYSAVIRCCEAFVGQKFIHDWK